MNHPPLEYLLQIDQAIRRTDGISELLHRSPDTVIWLSWIAGTAPSRTCGALEELGLDCSFDPNEESEAANANETEDSLQVSLLDSRGRTLTAQTRTRYMARFPLAEPGQYRLLTPDQTVLRSLNLTPVWGTNQPPKIWRLSAAPPESPPEVTPDRPEAVPDPPGVPPESIQGSEVQPPHTDDPPSSAGQTPANSSKKPEHNQGSQTLIRAWPIPHWALDVQLHRFRESRWLDVICQERSYS